MRQARRFAMPMMAVLTAFWLPGVAAAQIAGKADPPRAEIWGAWAVAMPISNGTLESAHEPPMRLGGTPLESLAHQVLNVEAGAGYGIDLGANVYFNRVIGVQGAITATSANVSGTNGGYETFLRYVSSPPPDYQPRENTSESSTPWAPTTGTLGYRSLAIGGVVRWRTTAGRVGGTLAGGLDIEWYTGELESLGYTQFILGGHSTLFSVTHRVRVRPSEGERAFGPYVGGDVHVAINERIAIMAAVRVRLTSGRVVPIQVVDLVDPNENTWVPEVSDVAAALDGQPLELPGTRWHTLVGVKLFLR
jgi:hypothetical protein